MIFLVQWPLRRLIILLPTGQFIVTSSPDTIGKAHKCTNLCMPEIDSTSWSCISVRLSCN